MQISLLLEDDGFRLYATSHGRTSPAGPRLFRAPPWPDIAFLHDTLAAAEADAKKLQDYLEALPGKKVSKKQQRRHSAD